VKKLLVILVVFAFFFSFAGTVSAKMVLKYGHVGPPIHGQHHGCLAFAKYVNEKTNGEIQIDVFPLGQLGGERSMAEQVQGGTLDMCAATTAVLSNFIPQVALYDLPFLWPSREVGYRVLADQELQKIFFDLFPKKGVVAIGYTENEMRDVTNIKRVIHKPEDMHGLKIRVMESPVYLDTFRQLGASPVPMPFPEIYNALQQGVIDAQDNPIMTSIIMKFVEVCPYATMTQHILTECPIIVNIDLWDKLTPEQRQIFREAGKLGIKVNRERNRELREDLIGKAEAKGLKIVRLTPEERQAFEKAVIPIHKKYEKKTGKIPNKSEYGKYAGMTYYQMIRDKIKQYK
jgi:tripartite ATP-independent transporter DctP family solute receptor